MELSHCPTKSQPCNKRSTEHFIPTQFFQKQCPFVSINSQIEFDPNSTIQYYYVALQIRSPYPDRDKNVPTLNSIDIICHPRRNENIWELYSQKPILHIKAPSRNMHEAHFKMMRGTIGGLGRKGFARRHRWPPVSGIPIWLTTKSQDTHNGEPIHPKP